MRTKLVLVPAFLLGSMCIYCTETVITRVGSDAGEDGAVASAHADPVTFSLVSEGSFVGQSEVILVEGNARVTVAISIAGVAGGSDDPNCRVDWVVPNGKLASTRFEKTLSSLPLPLNNEHSDVTTGPVILPKLQIWCENVSGPVTYAVYGIK